MNSASCDTEPKQKIGRHILTASQFTPEALHDIFVRADNWSKSLKLGSLRHKPLKNTSVACLFYQPSTRTMGSFVQAVHYLGGNPFCPADPNTFSSAAKGENISDTINTFCSLRYPIIVFRHPEPDSAHVAANAANDKASIINAGAGTNEHPTQALLDAYTLKKQFGRLDGLKIALVGDLCNSRTVHSLVQLLCQYQNVQFVFVAPEESQIPEAYCSLLTEKGLHYSKVTTCLSDGLDNTIAAVYLTRLQREYMPNPATRQRVELEQELFRFTQRHLDMLSDTACILHPLPRTTEMDHALDTDKRIVIWEQTFNGLPIRMTLLEQLTKKYYG